MENAAPTNAAAKQAQTGTLVATIFLLTMLIFGARRELVNQQYISTPAGTAVETELVDISKSHSPSVSVITQLQYSQQALVKAEVLSDRGDVLREVSQDFNTRTSGGSKRLNIPNWPDPNGIKVRLSVASQSITAAPPEGITAAQVPVVFEVNVYRQWFNRKFLWPGFWACLGLHIIVRLANKKAKSDAVSAADASYAAGS
ncbi:MAG: hypothetical protein AAFS04_05665 [Cyanobacteria bacterium J06631_9]